MMLRGAAAPAPVMAVKAAPTPAAKPAAKTKTASASSPPTSKESKASGAKNMEEFLKDHPYAGGFKPSAADRELLETYMKTGVPSTPSIQRWYAHIVNFSRDQMAAWI